MKISFECKVEEDVYEKFRIALMLNKEDQNEVIEKYLMQYIASSFSKVSNTYKTISTPKTLRENQPITLDTGKANNRIPKWAMKPEQNNHKIVRAFFQLESELGSCVPLNELEKRCNDYKNNPSTYVRDFRGNFNQMKIDAPKSHGKVFEVENGNVVIWDYVKATLMEYKKYFC